MDEADTLLKSVLSEAQKNVRKEDNNKRSREKRRAEGSTGVRVSSFFHAVSGPPSKKQSNQVRNNAPRSKSPAEAPIDNFENIEIVQLCPPSPTSI